MFTLIIFANYISAAATLDHIDGFSSYEAADAAGKKAQKDIGKSILFYSVVEKK